MSVVQYWFMFPISICIATCALTSGIGGAALFAPLFLILFPVMGLPKILPTGAVAIAIMIETFGFSSGLIGYFRRNLVDIRQACKFALFACPATLIASLVIKLPGAALKFMYTILMFVVGGYMLYSSRISAANGGKTLLEMQVEMMVSTHSDPGFTDHDDDEEHQQNHNSTGDIMKLGLLSTPIRRKDSVTGTVYTYHDIPITILGVASMLVGGMLIGLLGVGIGEVTIPNLLSKGMPMAVAAATSTLIVTMTCATAAIVQVTVLLTSTDKSLDVFPIVIFAIPGVIIGGQVAAALQGKLQKQTMEFAIGLLFTIIGILFLALTIQAQMHPPPQGK